MVIIIMVIIMVIMVIRPLLPLPACLPRGVMCRGAPVASIIRLPAACT